MHDYVHLLIGLISFAAIFGGALIGLFVRRRLPRHHLSSETQSIVTVAVAVIGTLSALVLGLMISAANSSFSKRSDEVREISLQLIRLDRNLRRYGPEADDAWANLHEWAVAKKQQLFPEKDQPHPTSHTTIELLEREQDSLLALTPKDERQKYLRTLCVTLSSTLIQARWGLEERTGHSIPVPFLVLLIFWLAIVFASFGLFAPANTTAVTALLLCSVAVAGGIFLIEELDNPTSGFIRLPVDSMRNALIEIEA
jgi:ABC-type amino acid transport system permease subunit